MLVRTKPEIVHLLKKKAKDRQIYLIDPRDDLKNDHATESDLQKSLSHTLYTPVSTLK